MYAPSVDANTFHSELPAYHELTNFTPGTFIAAALIASKSSALSSSGILNGSLVSGVCHTSTFGVTGARLTGLASNIAFASAIPTACLASRSASATVTAGEAAKPHAPFAITRTPMP